REQIFEHGCRQRIYTWSWNSVSRKRRAIDVSDLRWIRREIATAQRQRRHVFRQNLLARQTQALVIREKECPVFKDRPASERSEIVHDQLGHLRAKRIARSKGGILVILEDPAMKLIAAAFGNRGDVTNAAEFGSVVGRASCRERA